MPTISDPNDTTTATSPVKPGRHRRRTAAALCIALAGFGAVGAVAIAPNASADTTVPTTSVQEPTDELGAFTGPETVEPTDELGAFTGPETVEPTDELGAFTGPETDASSYTVEFDFTAEDVAAIQLQEASFAGCLREHGVDISDPVVTLDGKALTVTSGKRGPGTAKVTAAEYSAAADACSTIPPGFSKETGVQEN